MSKDRIDQLLTAWEERLRRVDENLLALEAEPTYQMLSGTDGKRAPLAGVTQQRVAPALDALGELFEHRERLTEVLDRAKEVRDSISPLTFWSTDEKLLEIEKLLHGPSIKMGTRPTPLAQRNLLDLAAQDVAVVPEQLLQAMAQAYDVARRAVMDVSQCWAKLEPAIESAEAEVRALRASAVSLGVEAAVARELGAAERDLAAMRARVFRDPLGVSGNIDGALAPQLVAARKQLDALGGIRDRVRADLTRAADLRARLDVARAAARRAHDEGKVEIEEASKLPAPNAPELAQGLEPWLAKIESTASAGRWQSADVGLSRWFEAAEKLLAAERAVAVNHASLASRRAELRGRLSARRAQAQALIARGKAGIDPSLEAKARDAEALLQRRPTPLEASAALVEEYEAEVVKLARG